MSMSKIPNKEDVITKARAFLEAVAREVQTKLGANPKAVQQSVWWSTANPENSSVIVQSSGVSSLLKSGGHEREVFDWFRVSALYQVHLMHSGFPEQTELQEEITDAGIQAQWVPYGFLLPLVLAWCKLPEPFDLTQLSAHALLDKFAEAVTSGISHTKYRDAIMPIDSGGTPIELEEGVRIRMIEEEELWELGSEGTVPTPPFSLQLSPSDNWCMLDIGLRHRHDDAAQPATRLYTIREAIVANLVIVVECPSPQFGRVIKTYDYPYMRMRSDSTYIEMSITGLYHFCLIFLFKSLLPIITICFTPTTVRLSNFPISYR